jgi:phosphoribosyl 1,2-cyclic phosphate phosphodiesterase
MAAIEWTIIGSGTSTGGPVLGCPCDTCRSDDPRDRRWRAGALIRSRDGAVVIDTGPEFRLQMLRAGVERLDAVLYTHAHIDHTAGLDDLRPYGFRSGRPMPLYASAETLERIRAQFSYIWDAVQEGGGLPRVELRAVDGPFVAGGVEFVPVPAMHGKVPVLGYRFGATAYLTDVSDLPPSSRALLAGLDTLVLGAVQRRPHTTHLNLERALALIRELGARRSYLTHLGHDFRHEETSRELPDGVELAYDGLTLTC